MEIKRNGYTVELSKPILYVDNESRNRSGHMSHALCEFGKNKVMNFNSNCSAARNWGHSTFGWIEYRISDDACETYGDVQTLPYSVDTFLDGVNVISVEKAVACDDGTVVALCLRNNALTVCQPWNTPMVVTSADGGKSWTDPIEVCKYKGRVYDACYYDGTIYLLEFCNDGVGDFCGEKEEHVYRIFTSRDKGKSFEELCVVPVPSMGRGYGAMQFDGEGRLHVFAYNIKDERHMDHIVSEDKGKTFCAAHTNYLAHGIRNPQINIIDGIWVCHGRAEQESGFVLYTSPDGENWDEGEFIGTVKGYCYYSNNIVLKDKDNTNRLLIQYSQNYRDACVNIFHRWLKIKK